MKFSVICLKQEILNCIAGFLYLIDSYITH